MLSIWWRRNFCGLKRQQGTGYGNHTFLCALTDEVPGGSIQRPLCDFAHWSPSDRCRPTGDKSVETPSRSVANRTPVRFLSTTEKGQSARHPTILPSGRRAPILPLAPCPLERRGSPKGDVHLRIGQAGKMSSAPHLIQVSPSLAPFARASTMHAAAAMDTFLRQNSLAFRVPKPWPRHARGCAAAGSSLHPSPHRDRRGRAVRIYHAPSGIRSPDNREWRGHALRKSRY
jgi:hypothetical protein